MSSNPCKICGGTDLNLVDGFYYCTECGTQDVNVRETVVEQTVLADGTFAHVTTKKFTTVLKDAIEMSGEWNKWHAYNFILAGLTEELMRLGAEPSVKTAVLWIWTRYIKMFQVKEDDKDNSNFENASLNDAINSFIDDTDDENVKSTISNSSRTKRKKIREDKFRRDIKIVTKGTLLTILYIALNLDRSDIQLSHLLRFIKEGRISLYNCIKFVPKEINTKSIPHWKNFILCQNDYTPKIIRTIAMTFFRRLNLGSPLVPDLDGIISNYVKELCLPNDFRNLVLSLMNLMPCDYLKLDTRAIKSLIRLPDYEGVCMSYILIALKMCFGLDCDYELRVSKEIDRINYEENYCKSYKLGSYSEPTDRLFSFQEWYKFLLFRKTILSKYYLPMARLYKLPVDECVLMEHVKERNQRAVKLSDSVTMDILNKISVSNNVNVIPKSEFPATLTPMTTYIEVILQHQQDPDFRLLLSEDFTQYSLKYAINDLRLPNVYNDADNVIQGVIETNKTINPNVEGNLKTKTGDTRMVFVRNCENKNWLKTKPPTIDHVVKANDGKANSDKESDLGYDSNLESTPTESDDTRISVTEDLAIKKDAEKVLETFDEEHDELCIFDDNFNSMGTILEEEKKDKSILELENAVEFNNDINEYHDSKEYFNDSASVHGCTDKYEFNPDTFDRDRTIKKLLEMVCIKYRIPFSILDKSKSYTGSRKRRLDTERENPYKSKRRKNDTQADEFKIKTKELVAFYYKSLENDDLDKIAKNVNTVFDSQDTEECVNDNIPDDNVNITEITQEINDSSKYGESLLNDNVPIEQSMISSICPDSPINSICQDEEIYDPINQSDPNFDPKTHNIEQLYVKLTENIDFDCSVNIDSDPELDEILDKNVDKCANTSQSKKLDCITSDSEDDLPLIDLAKEISYFKKNRANDRFENLVTNKNIEHFNYWMRHYKSRAMSRSLDMNLKFDIEITENCPPSFVFVIRECAAILDCTTFCLYKSMQNLEETLLTYCKG